MCPALLAAAATLSLCSCADLQPASSAAPESASAAKFTTAIADDEKLDPNSPSALDARLEYADFLLEHGSGTCAQRLDLAQSQLDTVAANPATAVVFPDGWDRAADLQYRVHRARADCGADPGARAHELQLALQSAQHAVQLFRDSFDYPSMAVAQFNVAGCYQARGDQAAAIAALEAAIAMDREFGLSDDAQDNYELLLQWRKAPAGPEEVAKLMREFPARSVTLNFAWSASDARVAITQSNAAAVDGQLLHSQLSSSFRRQVRATADGWQIAEVGSDDADAADFGVWPRGDIAQAPRGFFRPTLLRLPGFELTQTGDFKATSELEAFATRVAAAAQSVIAERAPQGEHMAELVDAAVKTARIDFAARPIADEVSQGYEVETAMWIGATLRQGVQYELLAPLALPGIPNLTLEHRINFSFTRELPCPNGAAAHRCVELIIHAAPEGLPLTQQVPTLHAADHEILHYSSATTIRIVTDPQTLQAYLRDTRRYWYITLSRLTAQSIILHSDHRAIDYIY